jgi:hypothetical protein
MRSSPKRVHGAKAEKVALLFGRFGSRANSVNWCFLLTGVSGNLPEAAPDGLIHSNDGAETHE